MHEPDPDRAYYELTAGWNEKFWKRLAAPVSLEGMICLDLGCGVGALAIDAATRGARSVVGIDPDKRRIAIARRMLASAQSEVSDRVTFQDDTIQSLNAGDATFDLILARDVFEHIPDLPGVLVEAYRILRPGGHLYAGFGPLYRSPFGDHGLLRWRVPWAHLLFFRGIRWADRHGRTKRQAIEAELNRVSLDDIKRVFAASPFEICSFRVNVSSNPAMRVFALLRHVPVVGEYFSVNVYAVLRRA